MKKSIITPVQSFAKSKAAILTIFAVIMVLTGCKSEVTQVSQTGFFFDTAITIKLYESGKKPLLSASAPAASRSKTSEDILSECFELCAGYEQIFSRTMEGSDVWNINNAKGALVEIEPETMTMIKNALSMCELSDGAYDITISPISQEWGFSSEALENSGDKTPPSDERIQELLPHVDYHCIEIRDDTHIRLKDPEAAIDLGSAAKGYIADRLRDHLTGVGVESGIIDLGGNILVIGKKPDGADFNLGIEKPFEPDTLLSTIRAADSSLVTSGVYHRYYEYEGKRYHHLLNTKTGYPTENGLLGVTILCRSSEMADMYSTTCFALGQEKGLALAEKNPEVEALFVDENYNIVTTPGWPAAK